MRVAEKHHPRKHEPRVFSDGNLFEPNCSRRNHSCHAGVAQEIRFFREVVVVWGVFPGLFLGDGVVIALLAAFDPCVFP